MISTQQFADVIKGLVVLVRDTDTPASVMERLPIYKFGERSIYLSNDVKLVHVDADEWFYELSAFKEISLDTFTLAVDTLKLKNHTAILKLVLSN